MRELEKCQHLRESIWEFLCKVFNSHCCVASRRQIIDCKNPPHHQLFLHVSDNASSNVAASNFASSEATGLGSSSLLAAAAASASNFQAEAARQFLHQLSASHALNPPAQVDLRESSVNKSDLGVWAIQVIPAGTRFGPFLGKWTVEPANHKFAWEVCVFSLIGVRIYEMNINNM